MNDTITLPRATVEQALEALYEETAWFGPTPKGAAAITALRAALVEPQYTHSADCYKWHHECAIARIEETEELREALKAELERTLTDEQISDLWHQSGQQPFKFARMLVR